MNQTKINSQASGEAAVRANGVLVGSVDKYGTFSVAVNPVVHGNTLSARAECRRLAVQNPGKTFVYLVLGGAERAVPTPTTVSI